MERSPSSIMLASLVFLVLAFLPLAGSLAQVGPSADDAARSLGAPSGELAPGNAILRAIPTPAAGALLKRGWHLIDTPGPEDDHFNGLEALVIFELPPDETMRLLAQTDRQGEFRRDVKSIERIEELPGVVVDEHRTRIMFIRVTYRIRYDIDHEANRIQWTLDPRFGNSLRQLNGYWELYDLGDGRTLARFGAEVRLGPAMPSAMQDVVTRSKLPKSIESTRKWVNSSGRLRR